MADIQETSFDLNTTENNEDMEVVTMVDVLKEEQELEEDACAVLGGSDEKNCTYSKGYLKRQALYACVTCIPESKQDPSKRAGVCLACSYSCHEGHDLIELYTKRNFRCDCGNNKFPKNTCNLDNEKSESNENTYNHNFSGLYCTCERPYPDPEDQVSDEMIQCIICEDWYHCRHLGIAVPPMNSYSEMICSSCISKHDFLLNYNGLAVANIIKDETLTEENAVVDIIKEEENGVVNVMKDETSTEETGVVNVMKDETSTEENGVGNIVNEENGVGNTINEANGTGNIIIEENGEVPQIKVETDADVSKNTEQLNNAVVTEEESECKMPKIKSDLISAKFWVENWRKSLCICKNCLEMYEKENVSYLIDNQDTVHFYEEKGKAKALENSTESQYEQGMKALSSLDRVKQVEAITEYNAMKEQLKEYLQKFAENKKIVREEDIREFFSTMESRKKQKVDVPYFCR